MKQLDSSIVKSLIEKIQNDKGLSAGQFAQKIDMTASGIYIILDSKTKKVRIDTVNRICKVFNYKLIFEDSKPQFIKIPDKESSQPGTSTDYEKILSRYAETLGYEVSPEGVNLFLRECEGKYRTIHKIRNLLSDNENMGKSEANSK